MSWGDQVAATQLTAITTAGKVFSFGGNEIVSLNPGEVLQLQIKGGSGGTTDGWLVTIVTSTNQSAGTVPVAFPNAADDWTVYQQFSIAVADDDAWKYVSVSGVRQVAIIMDREAAGTTDTQTGDAQYSKDGVSV